ncbi:hypothetical protein R1flu_013708 [Riccia fluitans]|uniref:Uncharacterized protein n=1 Tax=Riccia fluitans TaxID=41844 RepID=A0ABD1YH72_9MARC
MSKAVGWFRARTKRYSNKEKSSGQSSPSNYYAGLEIISEKKQSDHWKISESDLDWRSRDLESPKASPGYKDWTLDSNHEKPHVRRYSLGEGSSQDSRWSTSTTSDGSSIDDLTRLVQRRSITIGQEMGGATPDSRRPSVDRRQPDDFRSQSSEADNMQSNAIPSELESPKGNPGYKDWRNLPRSDNDVTFGDWRPKIQSQSHEKPQMRRYSFVVDGSSQDSLSSTSTTTDGSSTDDVDRRPIQRRSITMGQETGKATPDRRQSVDLGSQSSEADEIQSNATSSKFHETDLVRVKFDSLLLNWPKLKSSYAMDKHRYEVRLLRLFDVETEVVVVGQEPRKERWSLGQVDDGMKALGRAISTRGYPKLRKLSFERCRILFESPFATLAKAINGTTLPNLEELSFQHISSINNQGFVELAKAFKTGGHFSRLTALVLIDNGMQDDGLIALARDGFGSGNLSSLKKLHIGGGRGNGKANGEEFHLDAAREFSLEVSSSGHLPQLEDLRFSGCVHWKGVVFVVEALETRIDCSGFKCLDLSGSPLDTEGKRVLSRALEATQFSSLQSLKIDLNPEEIPILLEAFQLRNLYALQKVSLNNVRLGAEELVRLAGLLEEKHLPGLVEFSAPCSEITIESALALVRAYENNDSLVARLNIGKWPLEELQEKYEKLRSSNMELDELV